MFHFFQGYSCTDYGHMCKAYYSPIIRNANDDVLSRKCLTDSRCVGYMIEINRFSSYLCSEINPTQAAGGWKACQITGSTIIYIICV